MSTEATRDADLRHLFTLPRHSPVADLSAVGQAFTALGERHTRHRWHYLGFPVAHDLAFPHTQNLLAGRLLNNISTVEHWPPGHQHAMEAEHAVLDWLARLFGVDGPRWGHLTTGGTAGVRAGIRTARRRLPDAVLIHSSAAHYCVPTAATDFALPTVCVNADEGGAINLEHLDETLTTLRADAGGRAVIVVATCGTTFTEASDDLEAVHALLDKHRLFRRYVHLDAALAGIPQALDGLGRFDLADSVSVSGYKFLAVPDACGIVLGRGTTTSNAGPIPYTQTLNQTETGVRSGLHAALLYEAIAQHGTTGHRTRAHASRDLADYTITSLTSIGVPAWRHPGAYFTVVLPTPPPQVLSRWVLSNTGTGHSHIICIPGMLHAQIDEFTADLATALHPAGDLRMPRPRTNLFAGLLTPER